MNFNENARDQQDTQAVFSEEQVNSILHSIKGMPNQDHLATEVIKSYAEQFSQHQISELSSVAPNNTYELAQILYSKLDLTKLCEGIEPDELSEGKLSSHAKILFTEAINQQIIEAFPYIDKSHVWEGPVGGMG